MWRRLWKRPDWDAIRDQRLEHLGDQLIEVGRLDAIPTDVSFVRYVNPDEKGIVHAEYLRGLGFDARPQPDGSCSIRGVGPKVAEAWYRCEAMYPVHPRYDPGRFTKDQLRAVYDYFVDELVPCLHKHGYDVGPIPSWDAFRRGEGDCSGGPYADYWSPYSSFDELPPDVLDPLQWKCRPSPPIARLFPDAWT